MAPFKSESQQKACYAAKGFNGKVDCSKWSKMTDQKTLPKKVKKKEKIAYIEVYFSQQYNYGMLLVSDNQKKGERCRNRPTPFL